MNTRATSLMLSCAIGIAAVAVSGCVQLPTEKHAIVDSRPSLMFRAEGARAADGRVFVDNLEMGKVNEYVEGKGALRVLPGTHLVRVLSGADVLLEEKVYLGDGVSRSLIVK